MKNKVNTVYILLCFVALLFYALVPMWIVKVGDGDPSNVSGAGALLASKMPDTMTLGGSWVLIASLIACIVQGFKNIKAEKLTKQLFVIPICTAAMYLVMVITSWKTNDLWGMTVNIKPFFITMVLMVAFLAALIYIPTFIIAADKKEHQTKQSAPAEPEKKEAE